MFSWIRRRATYANVAMTLALVFTMSGGAYAAKKYLITSTKQISPSVLKSLVGKAGPAGAQGPVGAQGAVGPQGTPGAKGETGAEGKQGPVGKDGATGPAGVKGATGPVGTTGATGSPWPAGGTLPVGATETGSWFSAQTQDNIGFSIALAKALSGPKVIVVPPTGAVPGECDDGVSPAASVAHPEADSGFLCVFQNEFSEGSVNVSNPASGEEGASAAGALIGDQEFGEGTWAVTG